VTLALLWEEYCGHHPDGYGYSRFCDLYVEWRHGITAAMRHTHAVRSKRDPGLGMDPGWCCSGSGSSMDRFAGRRSAMA
jgi:transposase